jgi:hypothetical protein
MATQLPDISIVIQRLERLEKQNRTLKIALLVVAVLVLAVIGNLVFLGLIFGLQKPKFETLEAHQIILRGGHHRAPLVLLDDDGQQRASLELGGDKNMEPAIAFIDPRGGQVFLSSSAFQLISTGNRGSEFSISNPKGSLELRLGLNDKDEASFWIKQKKGEQETQQFALSMGPKEMTLGFTGNQHPGLVMLGTVIEDQRRGVPKGPYLRLGASTFIRERPKKQDK